MFEDHLLHFYFLAGPDFILGPASSREKRNILGIIDKVGVEIGKKVIGIRKKVRGIQAMISGSPLYPVCGLPGGISRALTKEDIAQVKSITDDAVQFAQFTLDLFNDTILKNKGYSDLIKSETFTLRTYYMGMVDEHNKVNFYDGKIRIVDPGGKEFVKFDAKDYLKHLEERVEPWSYMKILYLKDIGWKGHIDGQESGVYRVAPLARCNASDGMATPLAQGEYQRMFDTFGGKPIHNTLAYHWARLIEVMYAAERMNEIARDNDISNQKVRNISLKIPEEGIGACEAPRGTLFHHYKTDDKGRMKEVNLLVATQNNAAALSMSVEKTARGLIKSGEISEDVLNMIEMAFRAYDPCLACATHTIAGKMPFSIYIYNVNNELIKQIS
jgi:F420-non-reducing hydrogenase large subunit